MVIEHPLQQKNIVTSIGNSFSSHKNTKHIKGIYMLIDGLANCLVTPSLATNDDK